MYNLVRLTKISAKVFTIGMFTLLYGCSGYQYISNPNYVPVNTEKGRVVGSVSINQFQVGYAFSNSFSVYTTGFYKNSNGGIFGSTSTGKENSGAYTQKDKHKELDMGITYYKALNKYFSYELVSGVGRGTAWYSNTQDLVNDYMFSFNAQKINLYIQPNFSFRFNNRIDLSLFSRVSSCRYYNITSTLILGDRPLPVDSDQYFNERSSASMQFLEPGFQFRVGSDNFKLQLIVSRTFMLNGSEVAYRKSNYYLGLALNFSL